MITAMQPFVYPLCHSSFVYFQIKSQYICIKTASIWPCFCLQAQHTVTSAWSREVWQEIEYQFLHFVSGTVCG